MRRDASREEFRPLAHHESSVSLDSSTQLQCSGFSGIDRPLYQDYARCVHCGLCLNHCPTYRLWGREADSPRGRLRQMALVDQGRLALGDEFVAHIDRCLDCRACETACPSGVEYGKLVELARAQIEQNYKRPRGARIIRDFVYRKLLPHPRRIAVAAGALRLYQRSGLESLARSTGLLHLMGLEERAQLLPRIDSHFFFSELGKTFPAYGERRARVAFFAGCVAQVTFAELNRATIRVLQANGCEVVVPAGQVCCGALAAHAGIRDTARELARGVPREAGMRPHRFWSPRPRRLRAGAVGGMYWHRPLAGRQRAVPFEGSFRAERGNTALSDYRNTSSVGRISSSLSATFRGRVTI